MATVQGTTGSNEAAILSRVIRPEKDDLPDEQAKALLRLKFEQSDLDRLHELVVRNQDDELTPAEKEELEELSPRQCLSRSDARQGPLLPPQAKLEATPAWMPHLHRLVRERSGGRCEYCRLPEAESLVPFEIEHIIPRKHRGRTVAGNLAWSCIYCNGYKGPNLTGRDPADRQDHAALPSATAQMELSFPLPGRHADRPHGHRPDDD